MSTPQPPQGDQPGQAEPQVNPSAATPESNTDADATQVVASGSAATPASDSDADATQVVPGGSGAAQTGGFPAAPPAPAWGQQQPQQTGQQPAWGQQPQTGQQPAWGQQQPQTGQQPAWGQQQQNPYGQQQPAWGQQQPQQPYGAPQQPGFGQQQNPYGGQPQQPYGQPGYGQQQPGYGQQGPTGPRTGLQAYLPVPGGALPTGQPAEWGTRFLAYIIDALLTAIPILLFVLIDVLVGVVGISLLGYLAGIGFHIYNRWVLQGQTGQTVGKKLMKIITLAESTRQPLGVGMTVLRELVGNGILNTIVCGLPIGFLWPLWDDKKQTWADKIASSLNFTAYENTPQ
ncbi:RDD family protein [Pseudonocardiaceae bacterium YIM PH 21723]|nr:RDD family protein [Pseudonocardiaceae bacterium YIM PH 21723]